MDDRKRISTTSFEDHLFEEMKDRDFFDAFREEQASGVRALIEALEIHHAEWAHADLCLSECRKLCGALRRFRAGEGES